MTSNQVAQGLN